MSQIVPIVLTDAKSTPVDHTFNPVQSGPTSTYVEDGAGLPQVGESELTIFVNRGQMMSTVRGQLRVPVLEEAAAGSGSGYVAAPKVAYYVQASCEFKCPPRSDEAIRKDARTMLIGLLQAATFVDAVDRLSTPY